MPYVPDLGLLLTAGFHVEREGVGYVVEPCELGPVVLPTGRVVGCDPLVANAVPFVDAVAPGGYQLRAWVAILSEDGAESQRRIAALQLVVLDEPVAAWTMALLPGQDTADLGPEDFFGYGVDAGTGTLADQVAIETLSQWDYEQIEEAFIPAQIPLDPIEAVISKVCRREHGGERVRRRFRMGRRRVRNLHGQDQGRTDRQLRNRFPRHPARIVCESSAASSHAAAIARRTAETRHAVKRRPSSPVRARAERKAPPTQSFMPLLTNCGSCVARFGS